MYNAPNPPRRGMGPQNRRVDWAISYGNPLTAWHSCPNLNTTYALFHFWRAQSSVPMNPIPGTPIRESDGVSKSAKNTSSENTLGKQKTTQRRDATSRTTTANAANTHHFMVSACDLTRRRIGLGLKDARASKTLPPLAIPSVATSPETGIFVCAAKVWVNSTVLTTKPSSS